jgi:small basic protein
LRVYAGVHAGIHVCLCVIMVVPTQVFEGALPDDINEYFAVALLLIREKALGPRSFYKPYIDVLPTKVRL